MHDQTFRPFLQLLNREADAGDTVLRVLRAMPVSEWTQHLASRPGWLTYGVFKAMLGCAREQFDADPQRALAITGFVTSYVDRLEAVPESVILVPFIRGLAWKEHANSLYATEAFQEAAAAAEKAIAILDPQPALVVDRASAALIRAMALHRLGDTSHALDLVVWCVRTFGEHGQPSRYIVSLQACGGILFDLEEYAAARDAFAVALKTADQQDDQREYARALNNVGQCSVCLGELEVGERQLQQAFRRFHKEQMDSEMLRAVAGLAGAAAKQEKLDQAMYAFHSVYADFLRHNMAIPAAQVLVELTDVITKLMGNVEYAREQCAKLAASFGNYDVPGNVREAMVYVHRETAAATSVAQVRAALGHVQRFLTRFPSSPSLAFAAPA